jgi:hypothetical protein
MNSRMKLGDKIKFHEEKGAYTIKAIGRRYAVCTKPYNPQRTVLYTVVDIDKDIRGTEDLVFGLGAETTEHCEQMLQRLEGGETEVSHRNNIRLWVDSINGR